MKRKFEASGGNMRRWLAILFVLALMGSAAAAPAADKDKEKQKSKPAAQQQEQQEKKNQKDQKDDKEAPKGSWYDSDEVKGSIFYTEAQLVEAMHDYAPMVETYIQNLKQDEELHAPAPASDTYFLGRLVLDKKGLNQ